MLTFSPSATLVKMPSSLFFFFPTRTMMLSLFSTGKPFLIVPSRLRIAVGKTPNSPYTFLKGCV